MLSEPNVTKVWVQLYGGEQDGFRRRIVLKTLPPRRFYIWRIDDAPRIEVATGEQRIELQNKLATMAYEHFETVQLHDGTEIRYRRLESADNTDLTDA